MLPLSLSRFASGHSRLASFRWCGLGRPGVTATFGSVFHFGGCASSDASLRSRSLLRWRRVGCIASIDRVSSCHFGVTRVSWRHRGSPGAHLGVPLETGHLECSGFSGLPKPRSTARALLRWDAEGLAQPRSSSGHCFGGASGPCAPRRVSSTFASAFVARARRTGHVACGLHFGGAAQLRCRVPDATSVASEDIG